MTVSFSAVATTKLVSIRRPIAAFLHGQGGCCFLSIDWDRPEGRRNIRFAWCRRVAFSGGPTRSGKQPPTKFFVRKRPQDVIQYTLHTYFFSSDARSHAFVKFIHIDSQSSRTKVRCPSISAWTKLQNGGECVRRAARCVCACVLTVGKRSAIVMQGLMLVVPHRSSSSETDLSFQKDYSNTWQLFLRLLVSFTL